MAGSTPLDQIERSTLATLVAQQIRAGVIRGTFEPGSQLSEIALAERFGVSRGPVREALQALVQEGLLTREPHRGVFVPVLTNGDIDDIYRAREAIESAAVKHIVSVGSGSAVRKRLDKLVEEMAASAAKDDWAHVAELDMEFHSELVRAAESDRLSRMYGTLIDETRLCLGLTIASPGRVDLVDDHREWGRLLEADDPAQAIAAVEVHMQEAVEALKRERARQQAAALGNADAT